MCLQFCPRTRFAPTHAITGDSCCSRSSTQPARCVTPTATRTRSWPQNLPQCMPTYQPCRYGPKQQPPIYTYYDGDSNLFGARKPHLPQEFALDQDEVINKVELQWDPISMRCVQWGFGLGWFRVLWRQAGSFQSLAAVSADDTLIRRRRVLRPLKASSCLMCWCNSSAGACM
jgi:hypothetical protein